MVAKTTRDSNLQMFCGARARLLGQLDRHFAESPSGLGVIGDGAVLELLTSESGTLTILTTSVDGKTCMLASGENWESVAKPEPGDES